MNECIYTVMRAIANEQHCSGCRNVLLEVLLQGCCAVVRQQPRRHERCLALVVLVMFCCRCCVCYVILTLNCYSLFLPIDI